MYRLKEGMYETLKEKHPKFRVNKLAEEVGIKSTFASLVLNRKRTCSRMTAYCICKALDSAYEVNDLFVNEKGE